MTIECPHCGGEIADLRCIECGETFDRVLGVPFYGSFEGSDALGLIEIAANAPNRGNLSPDPQAVINLDRLCADYHAASDRVAFLRDREAAGEGYFLNRYGEWLEVRELSRDVPIEGATVLDIGAGVGFDSQRLSNMGAEVTALEFSPILAEAGLASAPQIRWVGGFGHALPFATSSFDAVFCNAALHHMRDIPRTISEALRVLKPGGTFISTCDSFRADRMGDDYELSIFDRTAAVLLGVNEQIPRLAAFLQTLRANRNILEVTVYTHTLYGGVTGKGEDLTELTPWTLSEAETILSKRSGSLALKVKLLAPWPHKRSTLGPGVMRPQAFSETLQSGAESIACLSRLMPPEHVGTALRARSKFALLNGWRRPSWFRLSREGYVRGRWLLRRDSRECLRFDIRANHPCAFSFAVDGREVQRREVGATWQTIELDLSAIPANEAFAVEIRRDVPGQTFEEGCFEVRRRRLGRAAH